MTKPKQRRRGSPIELTDDHIQQIVAGVKLGASLGAACAAAGFARCTWRGWVRKGEHAEKKAAAKRTTNERRFVAFVRAVRVAAGELRCELEQKATEQAQDDPDMMRWLLERLHPGRWGDQLARREIAAALKELAQMRRELSGGRRPSQA